MHIAGRTSLGVQMDDWFDNEQLHFAVQHGDIDRVRTLIDKGANINAFDELGRTPLHYAAKLENLEIVKLLLDMGADVNARLHEVGGNSPLREVAGNCSFELARLLIANGADPRLAGWMGISALDLAKNRRRGDGPRVYTMFQNACQ
jgi:ankyrin repeat protein